MAFNKKWSPTIQRQTLVPGDPLRAEKKENMALLREAIIATCGLSSKFSGDYGNLEPARDGNAILLCVSKGKCRNHSGT